MESRDAKRLIAGATLSTGTKCREVLNLSVT